MAPTKCPKCGATISAKATSSHKCDYPEHKQGNSAANYWIKIYIAAVLLLNLAVIFLVITGEKRKIYWLAIAAMALMAFIIAKLKIKKPH